MQIVNDQITFSDELQTEVNKRKIKGYYLTDNQIVLQVENDQQLVVNRSLMYVNNEQAYQDYVSLVNLNSYSTAVPHGYKL